MKKVLSTKTLNEKNISFARSLNLEIHCEDFIKVNSIPIDVTPVLKNNFDSVVFTSINAVKSFTKNTDCKDLLKTKNIFTISGRTNDKLVKAGVHPVAIADSAELLANKIIKCKLSKSILHPCGNLSLDTLKIKLKKAQIEYRSIIVYETKLNSIKLKDEFDAVLFFSPSGVKSFLRVNKLSKQTIACCIGETTANALKEKQVSNKIVISDSPSSESMIKAIANYFKKIKAKA